jgi:hypothetical protein
MTRNPTRAQEPIAARQVRNTAEPSGELSVGDVVAVGEAGLAIGRVGWTLVRGGLNEVRTDEHGSHPLPPPGPSSAPGDGAVADGLSQEGTMR